MKTKRILAAFFGVLCVAATANAELKVGYGSFDITPPLGTNLGGYGTIRPAKFVRDPLSVIALAFSDGKKKAVVLVVDILTMWGLYDLYRKGVAEETGLDPQAVFITCTHTHTGPDIGWWRKFGTQYENFDKASDYEKELKRRFASAARLALDDLSPASLSVARGEAKQVSFIRRHRMKDGTFSTNPGVGNPEVIGPASNPDEEVQLVRVDRPGKDSIAIVNFQCHPDTIGGQGISADWPGVVRRTVERSLDDVKCVFINGTLGDVNHVCTDPARLRLPIGDIRYHTNIGRTVAGSVIGMWDICKPAKSGNVGYGISYVRVNSARGSAETLAKARRILQLDREGKHDQIPGHGRKKNILIARARVVERLANGPDFYEFPLSAVTIGDAVAFAGFPGEPFTGYGVKLKKSSPFAMTIPACLTNGMFIYIPLEADLNQGGFETVGSTLGKGIERTLINGHLRQLQSLAQQNK